MGGIRTNIGPSDYLVLATALRRRAMECLPEDRGALLEEITQFVEFVAPAVSEHRYFETHTALARSLILIHDPISALDHIDALLVSCGAVRTRPPRLLLVTSVSAPLP
ncbi:hypothetical protein AB4Y35_07400 [Paraburkholderia sp. EG286A]